MRGTHHQIQGLLSLHLIDDEAKRRASFRQSLAALSAMVVSRKKPAPLEGLSADVLLESLEVARRGGFFDDLDWLSPAAAGAALYELAAALPESVARRDLGRRVLQMVRKGDASTFVGIATQLALTSKRALSGRQIKARVALTLELPYRHGLAVDGLALALVSRRELSEEWICEPSMGSLPARRLAARILERAAREAAHRARELDDSGIRAFRTPEVVEAWERLLSDREPLVYRHAAVARGLLSASMAEQRVAIEAALDPTLGLTEWRRGAVSLAASVAVQPARGLRECEALLTTDIPRRDPGVIAAMIAGLARPLEVDPDVARPLVERLLTVSNLDAAGALLFLLRELGDESILPDAVDSVATRLFDAVESGETTDDGARTLWWSVARDLQPRARREPPTLSDLLADAQASFVSEHPDRTAEKTLAVLEAARERLRLLEALPPNAEDTERQSFVLLRELDAALLETDALSNLLALRPAAEDEAPPLAAIFERLTKLLLRREGIAPAEEEVTHHSTLRMAQLRTLLHLVDADGEHIDPRPGALRARRLLAARALFARVEDDRGPVFRRAVCATAARALDALVREEVVEAVDALIAAATYAPAAEQLTAMAEASMVPSVRALLAETARLTGCLDEGGRFGATRALASLVHLADALPAATSTRIEAFRRALLEGHRALASVIEADSLIQLAEGASSTPLAALEAAGDDLARFAAGARLRLGIPGEEALATGAALHHLDLAVERTLRGTQQDLSAAVITLAEVIRTELPWPIASLFVRVLERIAVIPLEGKRRAEATATGLSFKELTLPAWMPPGRVLGGFYIARSIGTGNGGTVFVARRLEDRHDEGAEGVALKVPDYSGTVARMLSEQEFLRLFREEAGALLSLPEHPNIARFVTFDAGARPKPILVMELVEGPQLERLLQMGDMALERALSVLDGVAAGLEAMHYVGVGHLDLKPSNVIVRDPDGIAGPMPPDTPVLVDFGLSGRKVRPGCGTAEYGAPEVWTPADFPSGSTPQAVDVYAFACMAYEVLTGKLLFDADSEMDILPLHGQHDGAPAGIVALSQREETRELAHLLHAMLRRAPENRCGISAARAELARIAPSLRKQAWPLG